MKTINYYEIVIKEYNGTVYGRIRFECCGEEVSCGWEPICIIGDMIAAWRNNELLGSFGIDTILAPDATFIICEE